MDIIVNGRFHDGSPIDGYFARVGDYAGGEDDHIFYYFDTVGAIVGAHLDFVITDFERS